MSSRKGNTNALKHGLYAKRFSAEQVRDLRKMNPEDVAGEIAILRVRIDKVIGLLEATETAPGLKVRWQNALTRATIAVGTLARTQALLNAEDPVMLEGLEEALKRFRDERGL